MSFFLEFIRRFIYQLINVFFPSKCVCCGSGILLRENCLCAKCFGEIEDVRNVCTLCSGSMIDGECVICSDREFFLDRNITLSEYTGVMKEILHNYKFNSRKRLSKHLACLAYLKMLECDISFDIVTSVPISREKKWKRGFNQSEIIAKDLADRLNVKYFSTLRERSGFMIQKKLGYRDRFLNVLDRYEVNNRKTVENKRLLIVDDVITTGATINECARILKSFGSIEVYSLTIAGAVVKRLEYN